MDGRSGVIATVGNVISDGLEFANEVAMNTPEGTLLTPELEEGEVGVRALTADSKVIQAEQSDMIRMPDGTYSPPVPAPMPVSPAAVAGEKAGQTLYRRGAYDSAKSLAKQAADAEAAPSIKIHGVSVTSNPTPRYPTQVVRQALRSALEKAGIEVTQTGKDSEHFTAAIPKSVTEEFEKFWNALWK